MLGGGGEAAEWYQDYSPRSSITKGHNLEMKIAVSDVDKRLRKKWPVGIKTLWWERFTMGYIYQYKYTPLRSCENNKCPRDFFSLITRSTQTAK